MHTVMNRLHGLLLVLAMTLPPAAMAQDDTAMLAADPNATEADVVLPDHVAREARDNAAYGLRQANEARDKRRAYGEARADAGAGNEGSGTRE